MALDINDLPKSAAPDSAALQDAHSSPTNWPAKSFAVAWPNWSKSLAERYRGLRRWHSNLPIPRFLSASLVRRILVSNLLGLLALLMAMLYISLHHGWLLEAKVDVVKTVSRISAEAIAYRAINERAIYDTNRLPDGVAPKPKRDDAFAALELPIDPQQASLVLKKLVGPADLTARIYSQRGTLILDSDTLFAKARTDEPPPIEEFEQQPRLKNFWTRIHYWLINKELKVYRELGTANGFLYPEVKQAAELGVERPILLLNSKGQQIVSMAEPIKRGNRLMGVLLVSTQPGAIDDVLWDERWLILQIAGFALLVSIGSSLLLARTVADPMKRLSEAANNVSQNISARQQLPDFSDRRDEVGQMGRAFIAMTAALFRRIEGSEKFAADVAHELKNPLAAARSTAEAMAYAKTDADREELVEQIQSELKRLNRLISDVSKASRLDAELARQEMQPLDIRVVLKNVTTIFRDMLSDDGRVIKLAVDPAASEQAFKIIGNDGRLGQVFTNLIDNALSFSPPGGTITVKARSIASHVEIAVEDEGPGIPPDKLLAVFDRFYSDRPATDSSRGKNSGLGLSISREIIVSHRGEIFAENLLDSKDGKVTGARFVVRLNAAGPGGGVGRRG